MEIGAAWGVYGSEREKQGWFRPRFVIHWLQTIFVAKEAGEI